MAGSQPQYSGSIEYAGRVIEFSVDYGRRRNMYINVHPDCSVVVKVPGYTGIDEVLQFVQSRGDWILTHFARFESLSPVTLDRPYVDGAAHMYLGREITLDIAPGLFDTVEPGSDRLLVRCPGWHDEVQVAGLVEEWFLDQAVQYLPGRLEHCFAQAAELDVNYPELRIGYMKRSWGTCSKRGWIHLNSELIKIDPSCIDYVITHELCHLRVRKHSRKFYELVAQVMPDWRRRSRMLERYVIQ